MFRGDRLCWEESDMYRLDGNLKPILTENQQIKVNAFKTKVQIGNNPAVRNHHRIIQIRKMDWNKWMCSKVRGSLFDYIGMDVVAKFAERYKGYFFIELLNDYRLY